MQTMTAAAVAKEKAALYAEFARLKGTQGLAPAELQELEGLRHRHAAFTTPPVPQCSIATS